MSKATKIISFIGLTIAMFMGTLDKIRKQSLNRLLNSITSQHWKKEKIKLMIKY